MIILSKMSLTLSVFLSCLILTFTDGITNVSPIQINNNFGISFPNDTFPNCQIYFPENQNSFNISYWNLVEVNTTSQEIWNSHLNNHTVVINQYVNETLNSYISHVTFTFEYENKGYFVVDYAVFNSSDEVHPYNNEESLYIPPLTIKVTFTIKEWNFSNPKNQLCLNMSLQSSQKQWQDTTDENFAISNIAIGETAVQTRFLFAGLLNSNKVNLTSITNINENGTLKIKLMFPVFSVNDTFVYDPDFSILLSSQENDNQETNFWKSDDGYLVIFIICFIPFLVLFSILILIGIVIVIFRRRLKRREMNKEFGKQENVVNYGDQEEI